MNLETFFPYTLAVAAEAFSRNLVDVYRREFGLSREEWRLLFLLADEKQLDSRDLAKRTTLDKVQVSRATKRLQDKGLITRTIAKNDRRLRVYKCTQYGRALFELVLPKVEQRARLILDEMDPSELEALLKGLNALKAAMARLQIEVGPTVEEPSTP